MKLGEMDGREYSILRSATKPLQEYRDPPAATLLYRKLLETILIKAQSKYYSYGAQYLLRCTLLQEKITDWESYISYSEYMTLLPEPHKRKVRFWTKYETQKIKYKKKQDKKAAKEKALS